MRLALLAIVSCLWASPSSAQWAVADSDSLHGVGSSATIQLTMTVSSGDFIYVCVGSLGLTDVISVKLNGTAETLLLAGPYSDSLEEHWVSWTTSSTQSGSVTIDATYAGATSDRYIAAFVMTHSAGTVSLGASNFGASVSADMASASFTPFGSDTAVFGCGSTTTTIGSQLVGGVAATSVLAPVGNFNLWWKAVSPGTTNVSATLSGAAFWVVSGVSFDVSATISQRRAVTTRAPRK